MKKKYYLYLLAVILITNCTTTSTTDGSAARAATEDSVTSGENQDFSNANGIEWKLLSVHIDGVDTQFSRDNQPQQVSRDIYTLKFEDGIIGGIGAPNRYSGRYTQGDNQSLSVTPLVSTMMASLFEPENLREHNFLSYMQNIKTWKLTNNSSNLELTSVTNDGKPVKMIFGQ